MRFNTILLLFAGLLVYGSANAQTEFILNVPVTGNLEDPYSPDHSGARDVTGPHDLDGDGLYEVILLDYSGGGRAHGGRPRVHAPGPRAGRRGWRAR